MIGVINVVTASATMDADLENDKCSEYVARAFNISHADLLLSFRCAAMYRNVELNTVMFGGSSVVTSELLFNTFMAFSNDKYSVSWIDFCSLLIIRCDTLFAVIVLAPVGVLAFAVDDITR